MNKIYFLKIKKITSPHITSPWIRLFLNILFLSALDNAQFSLILKGEENKPAQTSNNKSKTEETEVSKLKTEENNAYHFFKYSSDVFTKHKFKAEYCIHNYSFVYKACQGEKEHWTPSLWA